MTAAAYTKTARRTRTAEAGIVLGHIVIDLDKPKQAAAPRTVCHARNGFTPKPRKRAFGKGELCLCLHAALTAVSVVAAVVF